MRKIALLPLIAVLILALAPASVADVDGDEWEDGCEWTVTVTLDSIKLIWIDVEEPKDKEVGKGRDKYYIPEGPFGELYVEGSIVSEKKGKIKTKKGRIPPEKNGFKEVSTTKPWENINKVIYKKRHKEEELKAEYKAWIKLFEKDHPFNGPAHDDRSQKLPIKGEVTRPWFPAWIVEETHLLKVDDENPVLKEWSGTHKGTKRAEVEVQYTVRVKCTAIIEY